MLAARGVSAGYGAVEIINDVNLSVSAGQIVALIGPNGAGKTTTLRVLAGLIKATAGDIHFDGRPVKGSIHRRARAGLSMVPERRGIFQQLTVAENLRLAGDASSTCLQLFPELESMQRRRAGLLSGGEQQMLALGRALRPSTRLLLVDELSLGLAPLVVNRLLDTVRRARDTGTAVLIVEQHVDKALAVADTVYVMARGRIVMGGKPSEIGEQLSEVSQNYLANSTSD